MRSILIFKFDNFIQEENENEFKNAYLDDLITKPYLPSILESKAIKNDSEENETIQEEIIETKDMSQILSVFNHPGLIEETENESINVQFHVTKLNIVNTPNDSGSQESNTETNNLVETFQLDPNHDYSKFKQTSLYDCHSEFSNAKLSS